MSPSARNVLVLLVLSAVGVGTHVLPHDMGVSTVGAISMLAAAYLPRRLALAPVLVTVLVVDAINGFYALLAMSFVYLAYLAATLAVAPQLRSTSTRNILLAAVVNAVVFYLISNITPMAMSFYPATLAGWVECYVNGLPFLLKGILANLVFGGVAFGVIRLAREYGAHRVSAAERH